MVLSSEFYSLHRKKVYTCGKAKYSKPRRARGNVGGATHLPFIWPPSIFSTHLDKSVYFLLGETVYLFERLKPTRYRLLVYGIDYQPKEEHCFGFQPLMFFFYCSMLCSTLHKIKSLYFYVLAHGRRNLIKKSGKF